MPGCLFCSIVNGEINADIVYSDSETVAFRDINPQAPVHVLVIPRRHVSNLAEALETDSSLPASISTTAVKVAQQEGVADTGYRLVVNTGTDANQTVPHLHFHVIGGRPMSWPPG